MRALSLHQPWASYIAAGFKTIETRSWGTPYRGPIAIHAAKTRESLPASEGHLVALPALRDLLGDDPRDFSWPFGCVIAVANLIDCYQVGSSMFDQAALAFVPAADLVLGDLSPGRYGWVLRDVRALEHPVAIRGRQGLWNLAPDEVRALET